MRAGHANFLQFTLLCLLCGFHSAYCFHFTDHGDGGCEINQQDGVCSGMQKGHAPAYENITNCPGIPISERPYQDLIPFTNCCDGLFWLDISCLVREKQSKCRSGYTWTSESQYEHDQDGQRKYIDYHLKTPGPLTVYFSEYDPTYDRYERRTIEPKPETMVYKFKVISSKSEKRAGFKIYCDGTVEDVTKKFKWSFELDDDQISKLALYCGISAAFVVMFLALGIMCGCYNKKPYGYCDERLPCIGGRNRLCRRKPRAPQQEGGDDTSIPIEIETGARMIAWQQRTHRLTSSQVAGSGSSPNETSQLTSGGERQPTSQDLATSRSQNVNANPSMVAWRPRSAAAESSAEQQAVPQRQISETLPSYESLLNPPPGYSEVVNGFP